MPSSGASRLCVGASEAHSHEDGYSCVREADFDVAAAMPVTPLERLRRAVVGRTVGLFAHAADPMADTMDYAGDPGLFGPDSISGSGSAGATASTLAADVLARVETAG